MRTVLLCAIAIGLMAGTARANNAAGVFINEVLYNPVGTDAGNQKIELINKGPASVDLSNWSICIQLNYKRFPAGATIPQGGLYIIHVNKSGSNTPTEMYTGPYVNINAAGDGISLYHTFSGFSVAANMEDFVQFGGGGKPRENTAVAAGLWVAGTFVPLGAEGESVAWSGTQVLPHTISQYCNEAPTIGAANACGAPVFGPLTDLRINEVLVDPVGPNEGETRVELRNSGPNPVNALGLNLCVDSTSCEVSVPTILPAGGFLVIHLNKSGTSSDSQFYTGTPFPDLQFEDSFALYRNGDDFWDPANMIDYFQWGNAGRFYESVAEAAGQWTSGQFFPAVFSEGMSIQWSGTGSGNDPGDYCADAPTFGSQNVCTISGVPINGPSIIVVGQNHPNPFVASTRIELRAVQPVQRLEVIVHDVSGRAVRHLVGPTPLSGSRNVFWDGRDDLGRPLPSGHYFYMVQTEQGSVSRKMTLSR